MNNTVHDTKPQVRWPQDRRAKDNLRQVAQAGVLGGADAVLAPCAAAVAQLEVGELPGHGVGGETGEPVVVDVDEPQLRAGCGRSLRTITRIPAGQPVRSSRPVSSATQAPGRTWPPAS